LQNGDLECAEIMQQIDSNQHPLAKSYAVDDKGALRFKGRLVIPAVPAVRREDNRSLEKTFSLGKYRFRCPDVRESLSDLPGKSPTTTQTLRCTKFTAIADSAIRRDQHGLYHEVASLPA